MRASVQARKGEIWGEPTGEPKSCAM